MKKEKKKEKDWEKKKSVITLGLESVNFFNSGIASGSLIWMTKRIAYMEARCKWQLFLQISLQSILFRFYNIWTLWDGCGNLGPQKGKIFLWLAIRNRCWTVDRLAKRGLPHPDKCPLCNQEEETIQHLLTSCVVARQVWFNVFAPLNLSGSIPHQHESSFVEWWRRTIKRVKKEDRKGVNSLIILGAWMIWKHRNACVF
jgi:hypothetical protein